MKIFKKARLIPGLVNQVNCVLLASDLLKAIPRLIL
jgi:hypothetical protein